MQYHWYNSRQVRLSIMLSVGILLMYVSAILGQVLRSHTTAECVCLLFVNYNLQNGLQLTGKWHFVQHKCVVIPDCAIILI